MTDLSNDVLCNQSNLSHLTPNFIRKRPCELLQLILIGYPSGGKSFIIVIVRQDMIRRSLYTLVIFVTTVTSIPVDNSVIGEPIIKCGPFSIGVEFITEKQFQGHIYVKVLY